jgi:hypothetical protein
MRKIFVTLALACTASFVPMTVAGQVIVEGRTTCADMGAGSHQFDITEPVSGEYAIDAGNTLVFQYYAADDPYNPDGSFFFTNSTVRINAVLVYAAGQTVVWDIRDHTGAGQTGWPSLSGPVDPATGQGHRPEIVSFCLDYSLFLDANAYARVDLRWAWNIAKTGPVVPVLLSPGESNEAAYVVTMTPSGPAVDGLSASGPVFIHNPTPYSTEIQAVMVELGEVAAVVTCPVPLPHHLAPFSTLACEFLAPLPDTSDRRVVVDIVEDGVVGVTRSIEILSFADATTSANEIDECVTVVDDRIASGGGFLGTACANEGPKTFSYTLLIGPFAAIGPLSITNTATFIGLDTGARGSSSWTVNGEVRRRLPVAKEECKKDGWRTYGVFKNQGDCVSYVATGGKNTPGS